MISKLTYYKQGIVCFLPSKYLVTISVWLKLIQFVSELSE